MSDKYVHLPATFYRIIRVRKEQCEENVLNKSPPNDGNEYCNATMDRLGGCWNYTRAGSVATIQCPFTNQIGATVSRTCTENGSWWLPPNYSSPNYIDFSSCNEKTETKEIAEHRHIFLFIAGYSLSIVLLTVSLVVFLCYKQLRCGRVSIHKNLFLSYVFTGITWILYYSLVAMDGQVMFENSLWCQILRVLAEYFTGCNFAWMFCEGLYLHTTLLKALSTGKTLLLVCYATGWGVPVVLTAIYAGVRGNADDCTARCWIDSCYQWILYGPIVVSLVGNIIFLINIIRLLMTKLQQIPESTQKKKAAKAIFLLVPLLGLQHLLTPMKPQKGSPLEDFYSYFIAIVVSLQGTFVAVIYCFCNGEVISLLRRKWRQHRLMRGVDVRISGMNATSYTFTEPMHGHTNGKKTNSACPQNGLTVSSLEMVPLKNKTEC
ncbi:calcitonin gene-related peptide type 1 receptor-like [Ylistrum balloti]|uniref:calcitonin gene-related peptide type 1 receptor-like n=1 Tax=Ylistrum balloti TaxID=509963 RepID=UPI002905939B|nr:calcitonin gene-related peptide type 1 receptor-like [Ylistrum balloti]